MNTQSVAFNIVAMLTITVVLAAGLFAATGQIIQVCQG